MRSKGLVLVALTLAACGWFGKEEAPREAAGPGAGLSGQGGAGASAGAQGRSVGSSSGAAGSVVPGAGWVDPEPPDAQARAEAVAGAEWNRDKVTTLEMYITTLDTGNVTGIQGFKTAVVAEDTSLEDRLTRLRAEVTGTEITIRLPGSVLFDFDSARIRPDAERTLQEVAAVVKGLAARPVRVEGHTDSVASDDYNQKLSERRAEAVRAWLAAHGAEKARLTTRGHGETKPVADNGSADGRQKNRRVEVIISKGT
ncbi:MAG TPA: OmpA family protein [Vicinamibacteria bacterium]|nr:OmpA family protein [Vicinamibacteria bacterium]